MMIYNIEKSIVCMLSGYELMKNQYFSDTLKKLRTKKGLSHRALADKVFVTGSTVVRWETGTRLPDDVMIARLAEVLDADIPIYNIDGILRTTVHENMHTFGVPHCDKTEYCITSKNTPTINRRKTGI